MRARKKRLVVPLSVVTLLSLVSMAVGTLAPEPSDPYAWYVMDWVNEYKSVLDPVFARFADLWAFYVFSTIWYLFLIAIVLQFGKRKKKIRSLIKVLTAFVIVYVAAYWLGGIPILPMSFELGMQIIIGSILLFAVLTAFIVWKLTHRGIEVQFK